MCAQQHIGFEVSRNHLSAHAPFGFSETSSELSQARLLSWPAGLVALQQVVGGPQSLRCSGAFCYLVHLSIVHQDDEIIGDDVPLLARRLAKKPRVLVQD